MTRSITTLDSNRDEFEDVQFNPGLVVVQKDIGGHLSCMQVVYVYKKVGDTMPIFAIFREISENGTDYWKEVYND